MARTSRDLASRSHAHHLHYWGVQLQKSDAHHNGAEDALTHLSSSGAFPTTFESLAQGTSFVREEHHAN